MHFKMDSGWWQKMPPNRELAGAGWTVVLGELKGLWHTYSSPWLKKKLSHHVAALRPTYCSLETE